MLRRQKVIGWFTLVLTLALPLALWGADGDVQEAKAPLAHLDVQPARVDWLPRAAHEHLVLAVAGPGDFYLRREFGPGESPFLSSLDRKDGQLPDGVYAYELRAVGETPLVQSGHLWVKEGSFVKTAPSQPSRQDEPASGPPILSSVAKDEIIPDDLVVQGHACIGPVCASVVPGDPTLKLRGGPGNLFQIKFEPNFCCFPTAHHWTMEANNPSEVSGDFVIRSFDTTVFRIGSLAPANALTLSGANLGLGTLTPSNRLHVFSSLGNNKALVEEASATTAARELLEIRNNGGSIMIFEDTSVTERWGNGTSGSTFRIDNQANAGVEMTITNTGNVTIAGTLTQGSSRDVKSGIAALDPKDILTRVSALPISVWSYKTQDAVRHVGPMAEDFHQAFGLGADDKHIAPGDQAGVALLAVQGLNEVVEDKAQDLARLRSENADLAKRVEALEAALSVLVEKTGAPAGESLPATAGTED